MRTYFFAALAIVSLILGTGCTKNSNSGSDAGNGPGTGSGEAAKALTPEQVLVERGRKTFNSQCLQCHNADFSKDGALGPAIAGSSRELLEARIVRQAYPDGYTPKRKSRIMPAMPYLANEVDALRAYLASGPTSK